ncbi:MAG TPA: hypothetical protein VND64_21895 [Pirellulales bacterium]|nr:hypothetical protein [Pirellulales bacterium]
MRIIWALLFAISLTWGIATVTISFFIRGIATPSVEHFLPFVVSLARSPVLVAAEAALGDSRTDISDAAEYLLRRALGT